MAERDELAAFEDDVVASVAESHGITADGLAEIAGTHQRGVRDLPGVDDIVYEWRNHFHLDPLLARTDEAYYLALPEHVWEEFTEDIGVEGDERAALVALHDRQARRVASDVGFDPGRLDDGVAMVLVRT